MKSSENGFITWRCKRDQVFFAVFFMEYIHHPHLPVLSKRLSYYRGNNFLFRNNLEENAA